MTNLITGVAHAWADRTPVVALGGASPNATRGRGVFQEIDQLAMMQPCTKWADRVIDAHRIPEMIGRAIEEAMLATNRAGASTLAAMAVPASRLDEVAELVSRFPEVNHNYERDHELNLWYVLVAPTRGRIEVVLAEIAAATGLEVLELPMEMAYHIDLGFPLWTTSTGR